MLATRTHREKYLVAEKDNQEAKTHIEILTARDPGYRMVSANYFLVGWTGLGEMSIEFAVQTAALPEHMDHKLVVVDGAKKIGEQINKPEDPQIVRRFQMGVLLSPEGAIVLSKLLEQQVENYKKTLKK